MNMIWEGTGIQPIDCSVYEYNKCLEFIYYHWNLLENKDFDAFYSAAVSGCLISSLTPILLKCGIDPLKYMDKIPDFYLQATTVQDFIVPNHITKICYAAFYCSDLKNIYIPQSVSYIDSDAFGGCSGLVIDIDSRSPALPDLRQVAIDHGMTINIKE